MADEGDRIKDSIFRHLRFICKLLEALSEQSKPVSRYAKVYGSRDYITYKVLIAVQPTYPDHQSYDPIGRLRQKPYRLRLARILEEQIAMDLVGYKVDVQIDQ